MAKTIEDTAPGPFKHFYASPLFDRMVTSCLIYFIDNLQMTTLAQVTFYVPICVSADVLLVPSFPLSLFSFVACLLYTSDAADE